MKVHYIQHVAFEGISSIESYIKDKGHELSCTHLYKGEILPSIDDIDWLIVMGGPMGIYDEEIYPWLKDEKKFIKEAINNEKIILGICLGAQLIADVLGAKVYKNKYREIGWFNISRSSDIDNTILSAVIPEDTEVFHWHGDTFDIPENAYALAESEACKNQGFISDDRIVAFQFHLETTMESAFALIENCRNELDGSRYVQSEKEILSNEQRFSNINDVMFGILDELENKNA
jgi:GMP synthase (glutamine-hydrolysing)